MEGIHVPLKRVGMIGSLKEIAKDIRLTTGTTETNVSQPMRPIDLWARRFNSAPEREAASISRDVAMARHATREHFRIG
jgi:hypothetical protein